MLPASLAVCSARCPDCDGAAANFAASGGAWCADGAAGKLSPDVCSDRNPVSVTASRVYVVGNGALDSGCKFILRHATSVTLNTCNALPTSSSRTHQFLFGVNVCMLAYPDTGVATGLAACINCIAGALAAPARRARTASSRRARRLPRRLLVRLRGASAGACVRDGIVVCGSAAPSSACSPASLTA